MKKLIASLLLILSFTGFVSAESDPSTYLEGVAKNIIEAIEKNKEALKADDKFAEALAKEYLLPIIDVVEFSRKTLGNTLWDSMSQQQQKSFTTGYINQVINKYAKGLALYDGQEFVFEEAKISSKTGNALVRSEMKQQGAQPFKIDYVLSKNGDNWQIINIMVEGTNMRKSYKNQFIPRINEIGLEQFLIELNQAPAEEKVASK